MLNSFLPILVELAMQKIKQDLSAPGLLKTVRKRFDKIKDPTRKPSISISDCLMSGLAVFGMKYPSLLQFDQNKDSCFVKHNLHTLYGVEKAPCDTYLRERLDELAPEYLETSFTAILAKLQRGKVLENYVYYQEHYIISLDGTGYFSSPEVHCENCCEKHHRDGRVTYYHQMLAAVLIHPQQKVVLPLCPEPIIKQDGHTKNDCERNCAKRLLPRLRREHPHLKMIIVEDSLSSNEPHLSLLKSLNMHYIIGVKPADHSYLFEFAKAAKGIEYEERDENDTLHRYRFVNGLPLNDAKENCEVNFLEYWEITKNGKQQHFTWITDFPITEKNVGQLMRGGRARWKIENETFNTLKNQGYHFEHNFGHGYKHLSSVLCYLMMLAFLIDQAQQYCCKFFQQALVKMVSKISLWFNLRALFLGYYIDSWQTLYNSIAYGHQGAYLIPNTS